ncbi:MAG: 4-phosphopantoate--beta-alanine ligase [Candidatus Altiarchaeota archaeon]|nr:4-phosphopantoate--beta-alanine ligase [Candidatus Altiarchaeota archaeon]
MNIPESHPRYESLRLRHKLLDGLRSGFVAEAGLIAHGRGEAFDYLLGEETLKEALEAEKAAVALLLNSRNPVISVNGNLAALVPQGIVQLAGLLNAQLEVNLFYRTLKREKLIEEVLRGCGAKEVFGVGGRGRIPHLDSERGKVDLRGIQVSDTVLVPLEDGDRTEALIAMGKKVISIDLNPLSRTSESATVSIVDNVVRAIPNMIKLAGKMRDFVEEELKVVVNDFDNKGNLEKIVQVMRNGVI